MSNQFKPYTKAEKRNLSQMQRVARLIARCFNGVSFDRHVFHYDGRVTKSESGETKFYESRPIDKAIRKINRVNAWLTRQSPSS